MKELVAALLSLVLLAVTPALAKEFFWWPTQEVQEQSPLPEGCQPLIAVLELIDKTDPIETAILLNPRVYPQLQEMFMPKGPKFDLWVVMKHKQEGHMGVLAGFKNGENAAACSAGLVMPQVMDKFMAVITGKTLDDGKL